MTTSIEVWAVSNETKPSIALVANMSPGTSPDCENCDRFPIFTSLTTQSAAPPLVPALEMKIRLGLKATRCGRPVICACCVGRIGCPVDIGSTSRFACVGPASSTSHAAGGIPHCVNAAATHTNCCRDGSHTG